MQCKLVQLLFGLKYGAKLCDLYLAVKLTFVLWRQVKFLLLNNKEQKVENTNHTIAFGQEPKVSLLVTFPRAFITGI